MAAKERAAEADTPQLPIDSQSVVDLMRAAVSEAVKVALQEARNPSPTEKELASAAKWQEFRKAQHAAAARQREIDEARCGHIRPENGKSLIHWTPHQFVPGAFEGHCSRCSFSVKNYDENGLLPKDNPAFQQFAKWATPTDSTVF